jgi:lathosterol oxidase
LRHNPTPFAVIADEPFDQLMRASPLLVFPMVMPINMDMQFGMYLFFFQSMGFICMGHELSWPDAHHPWLNTSFQHYIHHAASTMNKPYRTEFFFKVWDQAAGSVWENETCVCVKCARTRRTIGRGLEEGARSELSRIVELEVVVVWREKGCLISTKFQCFGSRYSKLAEDA